MIATLNDYELITNTTIADPSGSEAQRIEFFLSSATKTIENICQCKFNTSTSYAEVYKGNDSYELRLNNTPVTEITSITYISSVGTETLTLTDITIFDSNNGIIYYPTKFYSDTYYTVTYTAGDTIPDDLIELCVREAQYQMNRKSSDMKSESLGDYSYTFKEDKDHKNELNNVLEPYKNYRF